MKVSKMMTSISTAAADANIIDSSSCYIVPAAVTITTTTSTGKSRRTPHLGGPLHLSKKLNILSLPVYSYRHL